MSSNELIVCLETETAVLTIVDSEVVAQCTLMHVAIKGDIPTMILLF